MKSPLQLDANKFKWQGKVAVASASDLGLTIDMLSTYGWPRIIALTSPRTGNTLHFIPTRQILDEGGEDLIAAECVNPGSNVKPIHILNDQGDKYVEHRSH